MPEFKTDCKTEVFLSLASNSKFVGQTFWEMFISAEIWTDSYLGKT